MQFVESVVLCFFCGKLLIEIVITVMRPFSCTHESLAEHLSRWDVTLCALAQICGNCGKFQAPPNFPGRSSILRSFLWSRTGPRSGRYKSRKCSRAHGWLYIARIDTLFCGPVSDHECSSRSPLAQRRSATHPQIPLSNENEKDDLLSCDLVKMMCEASFQQCYVCKQDKSK